MSFGNGPILPAMLGGAVAIVDGHPVCATCGSAIRRLSSGRWRHLRPHRRGRRARFTKAGSSPAAITPRSVREPASFEEFAARFPWAVTVRPDHPIPIQSAEWQEGKRRLERFTALLQRARRRLTVGPGENPYLELIAALAQPADGILDPELGAAITNLPNWGLSRGLGELLDLPARRRELVALFSWAIPSDHALAILARHAPMVEGGAGMGYWAALLRARSVDVLAYDVAPPGVERNEFHLGGRRPWSEVRPGSSLTAIRRHPYRTLLLCWPPYEDDDASYVVLREYEGEKLAFVGERGEGAAGSVRFHRELALNWTAIEDVALPTWPGFSDRLTVYRRNARRLPHAIRDRCFECGRFTPAGSIGRCDDCFRRRPPALAIATGRHRVEYTADQLARMPAGLCRALARSRHRILP